MKRILYTLCIAITALVATQQTKAQESFKKWEYKVFAGQNFGGTTPLPLPAEIRKINYYHPLFAPTLDFHITRWFNPQWGLTAGIGIDIKGMSISADVLYMQTKLTVGEGTNTGIFSGTFSGKNKTRAKNGYITVPVLASFKPNPKWEFGLGVYTAFLQDAQFEGSAYEGYIRSGGPTGDKIQVDEATFDFSDEVKKVDFGFQANADWNFTRKMFLAGQLTWGVVPIFPSNFDGISYKMYNIYFMLGLGYRL
ncbi:MAG: porin family protein [Tannerellaceae bacterium]